MSAARAGYRVRAGDQFADVDLGRACDATRIADYPRGLAAFVRARPTDGWMYTGALENHPAAVRRMARMLPLLGNPADVLRQVRDPMRVADGLNRAGLPCPKISTDSSATLPDGVWLQKPLRSAGGTRISFYDEHARRRGPARDAYRQQYVEGLACSGVYLGAGGKALLLGVTRQLVGQVWTGATGFMYCGSLWPLDVGPNLAAEFARIGEVLAERFGLVGLFGADAILNPKGLWTVEVNPRYTASMELLDWGHGISLVDLHVAACQTGSHPTSLPPRRRGTLGKAIVFATADTVVGEGFKRLIEKRLAHDWPALADVPARGTRIKAGRPIVTVMASGADQPDVLRQLRRAADLARAAASA